MQASEMTPASVPARSKRKYTLSAAGRKALQDAAGSRKPWLRSTGPRTEAGMMRSAMNAMQHGDRSAGVIERRRAIRALLRQVRELNRGSACADPLPPEFSAPAIDGSRALDLGRTAQTDCADAHQRAGES
jgi:hypothetical protein